MIADWKEVRSQTLQLVEKGYLLLFGPITDELQEIVIEAILKAKSLGLESLTILIDSSGGSNRSLSSIKATMLQSNIQFTGLVLGQACSNAFIILQQCQIRQAVRDSLLLFHWGNQTFTNQELAAIIAGQEWPIKLAIETEMLTARQVAERSGVSIDALIEFALYERSFLAEEAKRIGFIDVVLDDVPCQIAKIIQKKPKKS